MQIINNKKLLNFKICLTAIIDSLNNNSIIKIKKDFVDEIIETVNTAINKYKDFYTVIDEDELIQIVCESILTSSLETTSNFKGGLESFIKMNIIKDIQLLIFTEKIDTHLTIEEKNLLRQYLSAEVKLATKLNRTPTLEEISTYLKKNIEDLKRISTIYQIYQNSTNIGKRNIEIPDKLNQEEAFLQKETVKDLLKNTSLKDNELYIICLYYGIIPEDRQPIYYNQKEIYLDGNPKKMEEIANLFSITLERCRQLLISATYKLATSESITNLEVTDYTPNPDLALIMYDINKWIRYIPFTDKYPTFYSYFKGYTKEEINDAMTVLDKKDLNLISVLEEKETKVIDFSYTKKHQKKLFFIIRDVYITLINKYGRRTTTIKEYDYELAKYNQFYDKFRDFYHLYKEHDKNIITYIVTILTDYQRGVLHQVYGNKLSQVLKPSQINKKDIKTITTLDAIFYYIRTKAKSIELELTSNNSEETTNIKNLLISNLTKINVLLKTSPETISSDIYKDLFTEETDILKQVLTPNTNNTNKLSNIEILICNNILTKLIKKLELKKREEIAKQRKELKNQTFYQTFIYKGYTKEEIDEILTIPTNLELKKEYLKRGTTKERKLQIIITIHRELEQTYGPPQILDLCCLRKK